MEVLAVGKHYPNRYRISLSDDIVGLKLTELVSVISEYTEERLGADEGYCSHEVYNLS